MLLVCKPDLQREDLERLEALVEQAAFDLRWGRRAGRLVLLFEPARGSAPLIEQLHGDPAVEYMLRSPSTAEFARIISRRGLLDVALAGTGVMAGCAVLGPLALFLTAPADTRPGGIDVLVGRTESMAVGAHSRVVDGEEYVVVRLDEKRFHALSATCTHSDVCLVEWDADRRQLVCPCHRGVFDVQGNVVSGPPPRPLTQREVFVKDGGVYIRRSRR
ncbi:MAG: QcrA and Rieske domain-containing protein [Planctomycetota bacterium]|jgi:cytochrome b6-f complex iron-sulfur subunit